jgi:hypothetical protein
MPPSKRWHRTTATQFDRPDPAEKEHRQASAGKLSERKAKQIAAGTMAVEAGQTYDMSLWKAIYITVWRQWWFAVMLSGFGSTYQHLFHAY